VKKETVNIAAVMVRYNSDLNRSATYLTLFKDLECPKLIYDNSFTKIKANPIADFNYHHDPENGGVSKAYNYAAKWALSLNCSHLLLLDSDSEFPKNAFSKYRNAAEESAEKIILPSMLSENKVISPFYFRFGKSWYGDSINFGTINLGKIVAINSGMLIPLSTFQKVNGFNEQLPLDWSDVDFCRKLAKIKTQAQYINLVINHSLSDHQKSDFASAKYRYKTYFKGVKELPESFLEKLSLLYWAKLKAIKLSFIYKNPWFIIYYLKHWYD
tara:strand:+ start:17944 stop:18756 length:813 start_codon:yes stop_codon:yes gene_type:complete